MAIRTKNLNLIPILRALLKHESVARAAEEVGLSQPATSGSLARLRELLGDPLLVRVGRSMRLTPRAANLQRRLDEICNQIELLFQPEEFDPSQAKMSFTIAAPDYLAFLLTDALLERLAREAPGVELHFFDVPPQDVVHNLESSKFDLLVCANFGHWPELKNEFLFLERYVIAAAEGHPLLRKARVHVDDLKDYPNPVVHYASSTTMTPESRRWQTGIPVVDLGSQISSMTQFNGVLLAAKPGMIARTPATLAWRLREVLPLKTIELAEDVTFDTCMFWTATTDEAKEHRWLRSLIRDALSPYDKIGQRHGSGKAGSRRSLAPA